MKKPNKRITLLVLLSAALLLAACGAPAVEEAPAEEVATEAPTAELAAPLVFTDDLGKEIVLDQYPERIVTMAPSLTEMLYFVGAGDALVGRDDFSVYPAEVADIPSFGTLYADFPAEAILAMEPDLVLAAQIITSEQVQALEDLGLTVYWQKNPTNFDELYTNVGNIAALVGKSDEAVGLVEDLQARVAAVDDAVAAVDETPVVFYELDGTDPNNPWTTGSGTFVDLVLSKAGGVNAAAALQGDYAQISVEALIEQNPQYIILGDSDFGMTAELVAARGGWDSMDAVKNGNVYPFDSNILSLPGPRLVDGLEQVARILHPDLFQ